jgi:hypothetical protein
MTKLSSLAPAALTVALLGCATPGAENTVPAAPAAPTFKAAQVEVVSAQFGVFGADPSGRRILFETNRFPAITAAPYGWYIVFKTDKPTVIWREEFELPEAPPTWGPGEALGIYTISPDRKTAVTERIIPTRLGFIANEWRYAPGDPIGAHAMRIYIDGQLIREFKFDIEAAPDGERGGPRSPHAPRRGGSTT